MLVWVMSALEANVLDEPGSGLIQFRLFVSEAALVDAAVEGTEPRVARGGATGRSQGRGRGRGRGRGAGKAEWWTKRLDKKRSEQGQPQSVPFLFIGCLVDRLICF